MSDEEVLRRLAEIRNNIDELAKYHTPEWIMREVLASMRLSDDAVEQSVQSDLLPCGHPASSWKLGGCGEGCIECANAATSR